MTFRQQLYAIAGFSLIFFILECLIKYYIILNKIPAQGFYFFKYFQIRFFTNNNIAFGLPFPEMNTIVLVIIILIILLFVLRKAISNKNIYLCFGILLLFFGALSNLIDRIIFGFVIDYINVFIWPVFNLADVMIVIGVILVLLNEFFYKKVTKN